MESVTILCIENSSASGSVALVRDGATLVERTFESPRGRGTNLFAVLAEVVRPDVPFDLVLIGAGPGSYNALRSSIAAGCGIARARGIPARSVCSLLGYPDSDYAVVGDARAGQWFFTRVRRGSLVGDPQLIPAGECLDVENVAVYSPSGIDEIPNAIVQAPSAALLARYAGNSGPAAPIYLKPPHITAAKVRPTLAQETGPAGRHAAGGA